MMDHTQNEAYRDVSWTFPANDEYVAVIHLLATAKKYQRQGNGKKLLKAAKLIAKYREDQVIRLDTLTSDYPSQKLFEGCGFHCCGEAVIDYPTTGPIPSRVYEYKV